MTTGSLLIATLLFFLIATLYSTVGHAGASGYLAIMAILSFSPEAIKPTSLLLNILVALIASIKFIHRGYFDKKVFLSFIITSLPCAFLGGYFTIQSGIFKILAGIFLLVSGLLMLTRIHHKKEIKEQIPINLILALPIGCLIGFISGLIGIGGGIFLSPIIVFAKWTTVKKASGITALFILLNSIAGFAGNYTSLKNIDPNYSYWIVAVAVGGLIGSYLGSKHFNTKVIFFFLFLVLFTAGLKLLLIN